MEISSCGQKRFTHVRIRIRICKECTRFTWKQLEEVLIITSSTAASNGLSKHTLSIFNLAKEQISRESVRLLRKGPALKEVAEPFPTQYIDHHEGIRAYRHMVTQ